MSNFNDFNVSTTHPMIKNVQQYMFQKKYVSIHSQDRDIIKYPISTSFEIELPQDYVNVQTVKLSSWNFPSSYYTFSELRYNTCLFFTITEPYNPYLNNNTDPLTIAIYEGLNLKIATPFKAKISEGFYDPLQMATELTNTMNYTVSVYLLEYLTEKYYNLVQDFIDSGGYTEFVVVFNSVKKKLFFGNKSSQFQLDNNSCLYTFNNLIKNTDCLNKNTMKEYINWGLPWFLGFTYCNISSEEVYPYTNGTLNFLKLPRFTYGDIEEGDDGYWLKPSYSNSSVYFIEAPEVINILGDSNFYIEIMGMNSIDETSPYDFSCFTKQSNVTNGVTNAAFAKIPILSTPLTQFFDFIQRPYKYYDPPAERIRRLYIRLRHHDGSPVFFGNIDYSFTLEFGLLVPHNERHMNIQVPETIKYNY